MPSTSAEAFWDCSPTLLAVVDPGLHLHELNPAWERTLGRPVEGLVGASLLEVVDPDDEGLLVERLADAFGTGLLDPVHLRLRTAAGQSRPVSLTGSLHDGRWYVVASQLAAGPAPDTATQTPPGPGFWQRALDAMQGQVVVIDEHGEIVAVNETWREVARTCGRPPEPLGESYLDVCQQAAPAEPDAARVLEGLRALLAGTQDHFTTDFSLDGAWFTLHAARFRGEGPPRVVMSHLHLPERRRLAEHVHTQAALLDEIDAAVISMDRDRRVTHWNRAAERLFDVPRAEAVGAPVRTLVDRVGAGDCDRTHERLGNQLTGGRTLLRRRDGSVLAAQVRNSPLLDEGGDVIGTISVCLDATAEMRAEREVVQARNHLRAVTDSMGEGLFALDGQGRVTLMNQAAEELLGWSLDDIGGQPIHDVIHHRYPDGRPFPAASCPLQRVLRDGETLRLAADVFVRRDGLDLPVTFTAAPLESDDGADGCVVVFIDATEVHAEQQRLAEELHEIAWIQRVQRALEDDLFELFAQPILHIESGEVTQHELLLRVHNADGSVEPPVEYLRTAETHGLIGDIDRWVVRRSLELAATGMHVEVNISADSLGDDRLLADIEDGLASSGADPALVVFEITETALVRDEVAGRAFVDRLHELGCKVALDDFGTGYGGFTYLKQLPVHYLKIDIEFVRDLCDNQASRHVVQAVVNLARGFGLETVAEGVEDERTLQLLRELGVDFAQGYHVGRPAPLG